MTIHSLSLANFRNYSLADLTFTEPRTLILGENGSGKSTILDAIAWGLTGQCRGVNAKGEGQKDLIRHGCQEGGVVVVFDDDSGIPPIQRIVDRTTGARTTVRTESILGKLGGITKGQLLAVLYGGTFFQLHHGEAKTLLLDALNVQVPFRLHGQDGHGDLTIADLDQLYRAAFEQRTVLKRQLAALPTPERPKVEVMPGQSFDKADLRWKIDACQKTMDDIRRQVADHERTRTDIQRRKFEQEQDRADLHSLNGQITTHRTMLGKATDDLKKAQAVLDGLDSVKDPASLADQAQDLASLADQLQRHEPGRGCVLSADIPCLTGAAEFAAQVVRLERKAKALKADAKAAAANQAAAQDATRAVRTATQAVTYHQAQLDTLEAKQEALTAKLADVPDDDGAQQLTAINADLAQWTIDLGKLKADHSHLMDQLERAGAIEAAQDHFSHVLAQRQQLDADIQKVEAKVKRLGPGADGIKAQVLTEAVADFETQINEALLPFQFSLRFVVDPWSVVVRTADGADVPFGLLSKGQQLWTGLGFQLALAKTLGLDFIILDDMEAVVGTHRSLVTKAVMAADLAQVIVLMAKGDQEPAPNLPGLQVIRLGQVEEPSSDRRTAAPHI